MHRARAPGLVLDSQVPGPTLRGKVGDIFTVTVVNGGDIGHSLDFHASKVAVVFNGYVNQ